jgi:NADPH:quinone reductase-like Zn-dependent oxidoreductase
MIPTMAPGSVPERMRAVLLTGHGGFDKLVYREDVPAPRPGTGEVLIRVAAAGVNNTDVNTRVGWYSKSVRDATGESGDGFAEASPEDAGWSGTPLSFPRIQGADCCGRIVAVGDGVDAGRIGERVLVRPLMRHPEHPPPACWTFGADLDGAFAEYAVAPADEAYRIDCGWSDVELASLPCAYSTAENLLHRAGLGEGERVLITGASGGVGSAAVQLARRRGAEVIAVAAAEKADALRAIGASRVLPRDASLRDEVGSTDVVVDVVGGDGWPGLLDVLAPGGRLATSGAIAGPIVELDLRTLYLRDLTLLGCTFQDAEVFANLVGYVERGEIEPLVARTYPLREIERAQRDFLAKTFVGKLVLEVPG